MLQCLVAEIQSCQPAAVAKPKPHVDQLEDLLGRVLANRTKPKSPQDLLEYLRRQLLANRTSPVLVPAPVQEGPTVNKLRQRLVAGTDIGTTESADTSQKGSGWRRCFSCGNSGHTATRCPALDESFPFVTRMESGIDAGWFCYDFTQ